MHPLLEDPWIAARIDEALAPYAGRLAEGEIAWMRDQLAETLVADDHAARLAHRARPVQVERSGEVRRGTAQPRDAGGHAGTPGATRKRAKAG
jgi:hypothetical protein